MFNLFSKKLIIYNFQNIRGQIVIELRKFYVSLNHVFFELIGKVIQMNCLKRTLKMIMKLKVIYDILLEESI
jgi:hypothetical protein